MTANDAHDYYILAVIGFLTVCSLLTRSGYFLFGKYLPLSESVRSALRYAPVAALVGIVVPELLPLDAGVAAFVSAKTGAALVAVLVFLRTRNTLLVIILGMVAFWVFSAIGAYF
jgi:branched-subunit amino acid transport protein